MVARGILPARVPEDPPAPSSETPAPTLVRAGVSARTVPLMADGNSNRQLSHDAAEAILQEIIKEASKAVPAALNDLAQAYAAVVAAMPAPPASRPRLT